MAKKIEPFYISLGRKIQSIRDEKNFSQTDLGLKLEPKVTRASIANIEAGKQRVLAHTLIQFAEIFDKDLNELVSFGEDEITLSQDDIVRNIESALSKELSPETTKQLMPYLTDQAEKG